MTCHVLIGHWMYVYMSAMEPNISSSFMLFFPRDRTETEGFSTRRSFEKKWRVREKDRVQSCFKSKSLVCSIRSKIALSFCGGFVFVLDLFVTLGSWDWGWDRSDPCWCYSSLNFESFFLCLSMFLAVNFLRVSLKLIVIWNGDDYWNMSWFKIWERCQISLKWGSFVRVRNWKLCSEFVRLWKLLIGRELTASDLPVTLLHVAF